MSEQIEKERSEVPEPAPVLLHGLRIEALPWGKARGLPQNGGYIAAYDPKSNREMWTLQVYPVQYDDDMEEDKQDLFIEELCATADGLLRVNAEHGRVHLVDVQRRVVVSAPPEA